MPFLAHPTDLAVVRPPHVARAAGITAGVTTLPAFERRYGKGLPTMGGHSGGARLWYDTTRGVLIHADGFNIAKDGEVLDGFSIEWTPISQVEKRIPRIRLRRTDLGLLAILRRGMSRQQAEAVLHHRLAGDVLHLPGLVRYARKPVNMDGDRYTRWTLRLDFGARGLEGFDIQCDGRLTFRPLGARQIGASVSALPRDAGKTRVNPPVAGWA